MSTFYIHEGTRYFLGVPFSYNEINYTRDGATHETFTSLGFKQVNSEPRPDDRYYVVNTYPDDEGRWQVEERDIREIKEDAVATAKDVAASLLSDSDWYVVRQIETGKAIPKDVLKFRSAVRTTETEYESRVHKVKTIQEFINLDEPNWPTTQEQNEIPVSS